MFERFTERARQVVVLAQDESHRLGHSHIGTEHLLLGLLREEEGIAALVLKSFDVDQARARTAVLEAVGQGPQGGPQGQIPFTRGAKAMLERSLQEAIALEHSYLGTEHLLLALTNDVEGLGRRLLGDFGVDAQRVRDEVIRMLSGPGRSQSSSVPMRDVRSSSAGTILSYDEHLRRRVLSYGAAILVGGLAIGLLVVWVIWG